MERLSACGMTFANNGEILPGAIAFSALNLLLLLLALGIYRFSARTLVDAVQHHDKIDFVVGVALALAGVLATAGVWGMGLTTTCLWGAL